MGQRPRPLGATRVFLGAVTLVLASAFATHSVWLQWMGDALVMSHQPVVADAVVVLAGNARSRMPKGEDLVRAQYAPTLYLLEDVVCPPLPQSCGRLSELWRRDEAMPHDVTLPRHSVTLLFPELADGASNTEREAQLAWERLRALHKLRILIVTDEWHSRRAAMTWRRVVAGHGEIISVPASGEQAPITGWWRHRQGIDAVSSEYMKFVFYAFTGRL